MVDRPPPPDPAEVQRTTDYLAGLADQPYAEALADNIMDPLPEESAAFRSDTLAYRSLVAARYLIDHANTVLKHRKGETQAQQARATAHFRDRVGMERRLLEQVVAGLRARSGQLPNAPNPRGRAMRRLAAEYPVRFLELVREEEQKDKDARAAAKAERARARREQKAAERAR